MSPAARQIVALPPQLMSTLLQIALVGLATAEALTSQPIPLRPPGLSPAVTSTASRCAPPKAMARMSEQDILLQQAASKRAAYEQVVREEQKRKEQASVAAFNAQQKFEAQQMAERQMSMQMRQKALKASAAQAEKARLAMEKDRKAASAKAERERKAASAKAAREQKALSAKVEGERKAAALQAQRVQKLAAAAKTAAPVRKATAARKAPKPVTIPTPARKTPALLGTSSFKTAKRGVQAAKVTQKRSVANVQRAKTSAPARSKNKLKPAPRARSTAAAPETPAKIFERIAAPFYMPDRVKRQRPDLAEKYGKK